MNINLEKTKTYYEAYDSSKDCDCIYCEFFKDQVEKSFKDLSSYLRTLGVDPKKAFEISLPYLDHGENLVFPSVQYVVFTDGPGDFSKDLGGIEIFSTDSHPSTGIDEPHTVLDLGPLSFGRDEVSEEVRKSLKDP